MSDEFKTTAAYSHEVPSNPFLALDLGERWGREFGRIDATLKALDQKVDTMGEAVRTTQAELTAFKSEMREFKAETNANFKLANERINSTRAMTAAVLTAVLAGIVLQYYFR